MPVEQPTRIITTTLGHPEVAEATVSVVFAHVLRQFTLDEALAELDFNRDAIATQAVATARYSIPSHIGGWVETFTLSPIEGLSLTAFSGPDIAAYFTQLLGEPCIVIENSPTNLVSFTHLLKQGGGVAVGAYAGLHAATSPLLILTVTLGIVIVGAAAGVCDALEAGLRERIVQFILGTTKHSSSRLPRNSDQTN